MTGWTSINDTALITCELGFQLAFNGMQIEMDNFTLMCNYANDSYGQWSMQNVTCEAIVPTLFCPALTPLTNGNVTDSWGQLVNFSHTTAVTNLHDRFGNMVFSYSFRNVTLVYRCDEDYHLALL
eukprot:813094_1